VKIIIINNINNVKWLQWHRNGNGVAENNNNIVAMKLWRRKAIILNNM
jgi:hypothetical protein